MNSTANTYYMARKIRDTERARVQQEKENNLLRFIAYNNRRCWHGLRPLPYPPALVDR